MGIILFACSDNNLAQKVKNTIPDDNTEIEVIVTSDDTAIEDIKKIDREISVIVSRGSIGRTIAEGLDYHVVFLKISIADIIKQVAELKSEGSKHIAVLGTSVWFEPSMLYLNQETAGCDFMVMQNIEHRQKTIHELREKGYDAVITNQYEKELCKECGLKFRPLITSEQSISTAYNDAKYISSIMQEEKLRSQQLFTLIDSYEDALVMLSESTVSYINAKAVELFGEVNDASRFSGYLQMHNVPTQIGDNLMFVNCTGYKLGNDSYGYMISFKDASNIRRSEQIIRRSLLQGFTAKNTFSNIYSESMTMKHCIDVAKQYAQYSSTILITGETGTGKELFAQSIHNASSRKNQPFVSINCASMSKGMLENELFGRVESNSAAGRKPGKYGLFELAHGGTLFLDEISELPIDIQARLLRVLQEKELFRIGDDKQIPVDVRVICSTNKDLIKCIEDGSFRSDLYYRINIMNLNIPPLRARKADIIPLFKYFIHMYSIKYGIDAKLDEKQCKNLLEGYNWPGNTRELMSMAERCVILCSTGIITESFLADILTSESELTSESTNTAKIPKKRRKPQKNEIERLLKVYKKQDVCNILGISRTTLWRLLKDD